MELRENVVRDGEGDMKQIIFNIGDEQLEAVDDLVRDGMYPNRAECIRFAIRDLLTKHKAFKQIGTEVRSK